MYKCLCDICKVKEADKRYSATVTYFLGFMKSTRKTDICNDCYKKLFEREENPHKDSVSENGGQ